MVKKAYALEVWVSNKVSDDEKSEIAEYIDALADIMQNDINDTFPDSKAKVKNLF